MHAMLQSGSPKLANGPTSTSQVKTNSDNVQTSSPSFPSHTKRKKRDHGDHVMDSVKRERSSKADDGQPKAGYVLKSEISNITENGGLVDSEGVEKLLKLMEPDRVEKKMDLSSRSMLVGVIAATDKFECLTRFLQSRGLPVWDEWLQDIHKGKIDAGKDGDKAVEEFLLVLLRALDKLPVNLHALQTCNIGRSVNHLRTNKSLEIQKKAKSLVDTWKKRVKAEMNIIETKSGSTKAVSWPSKSRAPEVSHGGSKLGGGSSEISRKSSVPLLPASNSSSPKPTKSPSSSPGSIKTVLSSGAGKDGQIRTSVAADLPSTPAREEKSSSSSQSHTCSQSLSGKEDARSSTAGSLRISKTSHHRKSINGGLGSTKTTLTSTSERISGLTFEKALDVEGKNHKLIVKIPNRGRSPALSTSGGLSEDPSPLPSEKHDQIDHNVKEKKSNVTSEVNTESWQSNDFRDVLTGSDEGDLSPVAVHNEDQSRNVDGFGKPAEVSKPASFSPLNELPPEKKFKEMAAAEHHEHSNSFSVDPQRAAARSLEASERAEIKDSVSVAVSPVCNEIVNGGISEHREGVLENIQAQKGNGSLLPEDKDKKQTSEVHSSQLFRKEGQKKTIVTEEFSNDVHSKLKPSFTSMKSKNIKQVEDVVSNSCGSSEDLVSENHVTFKIEKVELDKAGGEVSVLDKDDSVAIECHNSQQEVETSKEAQEQHSGESISHNEPPASEFRDTEQHVKLENFKAAGGLMEQNIDKKPAFDLNEGFNPLPFSISSVSGCLPASITVTAAAKGPFVPIQDLLRSKGELGWKGSAATSAFRPAEPRKILEIPMGSSSSKNERPLLDFDLNVADERCVEESAVSGLKSNLTSDKIMGPVTGFNSGRFELDLNSVVEANDMGQCLSTSGSSTLESPFLKPKSASHSGFPKGEFLRGFDLNNGPMLDEDTAEQLTFKPRVPVGGIGVNSGQIGNFSSWYSSENTYSTITVPSVFHDRGNKPFSVISPQYMPVHSTTGSLTPDLYRGSVLSSAPALPYPSTSFQYPSFPFGPSFPLAPATFSGGLTPFMDPNARFGHASVAPPSHVQHPYVVGLQDGSGINGVDNNRKWGLDLNAGPGGGDIEGRDETMLRASRQYSIAASQAMLEEQAKMQHLSGGNFKRKEPEGSWDTESFRHKQSPWQ